MAWCKEISLLKIPHAGIRFHVTSRYDGVNWSNSRILIKRQNSYSFCAKIQKHKYNFENQPLFAVNDFRKASFRLATQFYAAAKFIQFPTICRKRIFNSKLWEDWANGDFNRFLLALKLANVSLLPILMTDDLNMQVIFCFLTVERRLFYRTIFFLYTTCSVILFVISLRTRPQVWSVRVFNHQNGFAFYIKINNLVFVLFRTYDFDVIHQIS